jgi:hypothetical protein
MSTRLMAQVNSMGDELNAMQDDLKAGAGRAGKLPVAGSQHAG